MRSTLILFCIVLAATCRAESVTWTFSTGSTNTATSYATAFVGDVDEIAVYSTVATGRVSIAALDPYNGTALVLATNAAVGTFKQWTPRLVAATDGGATSRVVTNNASFDRFNAQGEKIRAVITGSRTGVTYRVRIKVK